MYLGFIEIYAGVAMGFETDKNKSDYIRKMLLKTVGKNPDLFCYFASILEAKQLMGYSDIKKVKENKIEKPNKEVTSC